MKHTYVRGRRSFAGPLMLTGAVAASLALAACGSSDESTASSGGASATQEAAAAEAVPTKMTPELCGTKPVIIGYNDGLGSNGFRRVSKSLFGQAAAECPNVKKVIYTDAQGDPQKQVSDFKALVAQGANVIVTFADAGPALLPTIKQATRKGVAVAAMSIDPGGKAGEDYAAFVRYDDEGWGRTWGEWMCERLPDGGNVVFFGGPAGVASSQSELRGIKASFRECPEVKLLDPAPVSTDWTVAGAQTAASAILAKYPKIDGVISDYAGGAEGALAAWKTAGRDVPPWAVSDDSNSFVCKILEADAPMVGTDSGPRALVYGALIQGLAAYNGTETDVPSKIDAKITANSFDDGPKPECDPEFPPGTSASWGVTPAEIKALG